MTGSPHLLGYYFEVLCDMDTARPSVHTLGAGTEQATSSSDFGERSFHVRRRLAFDLTPASKSQELN